MKKWIISCLCLLLFSSPILAFNCDNIKKNVVDKSFKISDQYYVKFSESFNTECPKGCAEIFDVALVDPIETCIYDTVNTDLISVTCDSDTLYFLLYDKVLLLIEQDDFIMQPMVKAASEIDEAINE